VALRGFFASMPRKLPIKPIPSEGGMKIMFRLPKSLICAALTLAALFTFIASPATAGDEAAEPAVKVFNDAYPLDFCPVSGKKFGADGAAVIEEINGSEVGFCCPGCVEPYKSDPAHTKKVEEAIIKAQFKHYPLNVCPISGQELGPKMEDGVSHVFNNRLVRLCCPGCINAVKKDPEAIAMKLDDAVKAAQVENYPLATCPVSGKPHGSAKQIVHANRLVQLCCPGCVGAYNKNPAKYIAMLDEAAEAEAIPETATN